jgi:hypothetical protein
MTCVVGPNWYVFTRIGALSVLDRWGESGRTEMWTV